MHPRPSNSVFSPLAGGASNLRPRSLLRSHHHQFHELACGQLQGPLAPTGQLIIQPRQYSNTTHSLSKQFNFDSNPETSFLERIGLRRKQYRETHPRDQAAATMALLYGDDTPDEVKNAKGFHLLTMNTPNGQAVQIYLEELKDVYGLDWTTTLIDISTNKQKEDWFLRLDPNGLHPNSRISTKDCVL